MKYFGASVDLEGADVSTASLAAVMLIRRPDTVYAVVFGYGSSLISDSAVESRFGLRATLNAVEPSELRSVDHKRLDAVSRHTREQLSRAGPLDQFGLDVNRDLLRAVTGTPKDRDKFGSRLSGADQLTVVADVPLRDLPKKLDVFGELAARTSYRKEFPWVDHIRHVEDPALVERLEGQLAEDLAEGSDSLWLSPPEIIDWATTGGFKYKNSRTEEPDADLSLDRYFDVMGSAEDLDGGRRLRHDRIYHIRTDTESGVHSWPVIKCLVGEVELAGERYVLNEGLWYRVDHVFLEDLDAYCAKIPVGSVSLPPYDATLVKNEEQYNHRVWKSNKSNCACLDRDFVYFPKRGNVEVCDLYMKNRVLVHVKRMSASSTLSHLFNQGAVSAELLREEPEFRRQFLKKIPNFGWGEAKDPIDPATFEVCYAIVQRPNKPLALPFFSKLSLRTAIQHLERLRFKASLLGVPAS